MPLKKLLFKVGVNQENTRYTNEGGWFSCDKIRFRQGTPEKIGGWEQFSANEYLGVARTLWPWATLNNLTYLGVGTHLKYYVMVGGAYYDVTPVRATTSPGDINFYLVQDSNIMTVTDVGHGCKTGDFVTFSNAIGFGGNVTAAVINQEYQVTVIDADNYTVTLPVYANVDDFIYLELDFLTNQYFRWQVAETAIATYQINTGSDIQVPLSGWGGGTWGSAAWGIGQITENGFRVWNAQNFGEDLIFGPQGKGLYYWDSSAGLSTKGVALSSLAGASDVPTIQNNILVSDASRFVLAFGVNDYGSATQDLMLIRWSDQESAVNWTPAATNQAGSLRLSHGSQILAVAQVRQEILVWTDISLYSLQYLGPPIVWGSQLLADNVSIVSDRAMATAAGVTYWMGSDKFYVYDGRVQTMSCDLLRYVFEDFNQDQVEQVFGSTIEKFNEVWWFYCSKNSNSIDRYVVYNYTEKCWYYGTMNRTAWLDSSILSHLPIAAGGNNKLIYHEIGTDDVSTGSPVPIEAHITSSEFDIDDGYNLGFVWRILPDITFRGSTVDSPKAMFTLLPLQNSGSGYNDPRSVAGSDEGQIVRSATVPVEKFTGQTNIRVRGRQMSLKVASDELGVQWQLGAPRIDIRPDGRKS